MFKLICAKGEDKGRYYKSYNHENFSITYCDSYDEAPEFNSSDTSSIICGAIDMMCVVLVPQKTVKTESGDCDGLINILALSFFQQPSDSMRDLMKLIIRDIGCDIKNESGTPEIKSQDPSYMSVYEYLYYGLRTC